MTESTVFQVCAKEDEQKNIGGADTDSNTEDSLAAPYHVVEYPLDTEPHMTKLSGNPHPQEVVEQENQTQDSKVLARPSPGLKYEDHGNACKPKVGIDQVSTTFGYYDVIFQEIPEREDQHTQQHDVPDRGKCSLSVF
ncbi:hypothetical protein SDC9_97217 [bioreactor metagenome]|uniref:Uncharacterized protein n=1 Tax=bioreactor metagenome TaxID=1076179 RepID=A0A645AC05_9ZZZZ